jgi:hypothetical protein
MAELDHPLKAGVEHLRAAILTSDAEITEHVKWKAPSFCRDGEDRITFQLRRPDRIQLVFHRGATVRADTGSFSFYDPTGLLQWATTDRAVVTFGDLAEIEARTGELQDLVGRWVVA